MTGGVMMRTPESDIGVCLCEGQNIFDYYYSTSLLFLQDHLIFFTRNRILDPQRQTGFSVEPNFLVEMFDFSCMTPSSTRGRLNVCLELSLDPTRSPFRHWRGHPRHSFTVWSDFVTRVVLGGPTRWEVPDLRTFVVRSSFSFGHLGCAPVWVVKNQTSMSKPNKLWPPAFKILDK